MIKAVIGSWLGRGILAGSCPRLPRGLSVKTHSPGVGASAQGDAGYSSYMAACPRLSLLLSLLILERACGHSRQEKGAGRSLRLDAAKDEGHPRPHRRPRYDQEGAGIGGLDDGP